MMNRSMRRDRMRMRIVVVSVAVAIVGLAAVGTFAQGTKTRETAPAPHPNGKRGGVLMAMHREDLAQGFSIHETATVSTTWPSMPCFNNLVLFDPFKPTETLDTIIPELAERWSWQDGYRNLVFFLRKNVKRSEEHTSELQSR